MFFLVKNCNDYFINFAGFLIVFSLQSVTAERSEDLGLVFVNSKNSNPVGETRDQYTYLISLRSNVINCVRFSRLLLYFKYTPGMIAKRVFVALKIFIYL